MLRRAGSPLTSPPAWRRPPSARHLPPGTARVCAVPVWRPMQIGERDVRRHQPRQGVLPRARADEGRPDRVLRGRRAVRAPPRAPAADADEALPGRRGRVLLLPEARSGSPSGLARHVPHRLPERPARGLPGRRRRRRARLDREPRLHRAAHAGTRGRRRRAAGLPADRPRPERGEPLVARPRDRDGRQGGDGRARPPLASRRPPARPGCTSSRRSSPSSSSRTSATSRRRSRRRSSGGSATSGSRRRRGRSPTALGVFVDYGQNARDRTIASAYSIRPTPDARASAPLTWDEVPRCDPSRVHAEDDARADRQGRRPHRRDVEAEGLDPREVREARARSCRHREVASAPRRLADLAPRALLRLACRRGSGSASCRGGSGGPAPCRSAPRRRASASPPTGRARRSPSGSARRTRGRARPSAAGAIRFRISSWRLAATAAVPT